jgi:hypothetical protein
MITAPFRETIVMVEFKVIYSVKHRQGQDIHENCGSKPQMQLSSLIAAEASNDSDMNI